ncbi:hypothetical protein [Burkholderia vietnamiensis]|uniref:hypothetical protein n=1 Tax=Burkholderia vietnamiensis TaxID=60552 RepID=UPI00075D9A95|nr:hypothetical protein [Burkholderia vietnamiensis]KVE72450.1 hypothetical protein WI98_01055 [Burkholderia vietnamiensis]
MNASIERNTPSDRKKIKRKRRSIKELNALGQHIVDTWTPEMDEQIERDTRQAQLARWAKLTEEKMMCVAQRARLMRDLKIAVTEKSRGDVLGVDLVLDHIRANLVDLGMRELTAMDELRAIRAQLRQA